MHNRGREFEQHEHFRTLKSCDSNGLQVSLKKSGSEKVFDPGNALN